MIYNTNRNLTTLVAVCFIGLLMLGCAQKQQNQTQNVTTNVSISNATMNQTQNENATIVNQTIVQNVSANVSSLDESDFLIMDDSVSNLLTNTPAAPEIQEPQ